MPNSPDPALPRETFQEVVALLSIVTPVDAAERHGLLYAALSDRRALGGLDYNGASDAYVRALVIHLAQFGDDTPGVPALSALLAQVGGQIGQNKQVIADSLHARIRAHFHPELIGQASPSLTEPQTLSAETKPDLPTVFVAHASADQRIAREVCAHLEADGDMACWLALRDIPTGARWTAEIGQAIGRADLFLLLFSKDAAASPNVSDEITVAHERTPRPPRHILRLDDTPIPDALRIPLAGIQYVDARESDALPAFARRRGIG